MKRPTTQLLNIDRSHNRWLTPNERDRLLNSKQIQKCKPLKRKSTIQTYILIPQPTPLRSIHESSPNSITASDMRIFAGMGERSEIIRVRAKVREFDDGRLQRVLNRIAHKMYEEYRRSASTGKKNQELPVWDKLEDKYKDHWRKRAAKKRRQRKVIVSGLLVV